MQPIVLINVTLSVCSVLTWTEIPKDLNAMNVVIEAEQFIG